MRVGIMGAGGIARMMAKTLINLKHQDISLYAIGSRTKENAEAFQKEFNVEKAYGSYEDLVKDPKVDLVYIATPHSEHYSNCLLCIAHKKPILVEKAFTANTKQAEEILTLARENNVFITEAIWTRYMPSRRVIADIINSKEYGEVQTVEANLSYPISEKTRIWDPKLAGGALLDIGVYPINFAMMFLGHDLKEVTGYCDKLDTGVDGVDHITLKFANGVVANLTASTLNPSARMGYIYFKNHYIAVTNINNPEKIELYDYTHNLIKTFAIPEQVTGYEYQVISCYKALKEEKLSCPEMTHQETIDVMKVMDSLRKQWNIVYPFEK